MFMSNIGVELTEFKGMPAIQLNCGNAFAVLVPGLGSNVVRFRDNERNIEVFRYSDDAKIEDISAKRYLWGLCNLYLANRLRDGVLRTSDATYQLPINEPSMHNFIHGFIHDRSHKLKSYGVVNETGRAYAETEYIYDKNDEFYQYFPVDFIFNVRVELSDKKGSPRLKHTIRLTNISPKKLPLSVATHTAISAPFVAGGKASDVRLQIPIEERLQLDESRWLPCGLPNLPLSDYDMLYKNGENCPVEQDINNNMYKLAAPEVDVNRTVMTDVATGRKIINSLGNEYKFTIIWNDGGFKNYFCPETMTAQIDAPNLDLPASETGYAELGPNGEFAVSQWFYTK
jgi:aldose 1-epimerase